MKKSELYVFLMLSLAMFVPIPGRLCYVTVLLVLMYLQTVLGILFRNFCARFVSEGLQNVISVVFIVFLTVLFRQAIIAFSPIVAFTLGICFYMPSISAFVLGNIYNKNEYTLTEHVVSVSIKSLVFSIYAVLFFLVREIFSYGTISLPKAGGILEIQVVQDTSKIFAGSILASVPGALFLIVFISSLIRFVLNKLEILDTSEED